MSRTRLIRPEFFDDELMARVSIPTRLVYIGLWTLCDDAGYFELKPRQIAAALFPYDGQARRQRIVDGALTELHQLGRVRYLECGAHGEIPTLPRHGAKGGSKAETYKIRHTLNCSVRTTDDAVRTSPDKSSSGKGGDRVGFGSSSARVEEGAQARDDGDSVFRSLVPFPGKTA